MWTALHALPSFCTCHRVPCHAPARKPCTAPCTATCAPASRRSGGARPWHQLSAACRPRALLIPRGLDPPIWLHKLQGLTSMDGADLADSILTFTEERPANPKAFR